MWLALACGSAAALDDALPPTVARALDAAGLPPEALAAIAIPRTRWARTWQHRADVPVQPGSTMKLVTTIVALDALGPNHRGFTELHAAGPIEAGVLRGDLVLVGGADPDLDAAALWPLLAELRQRHGVHTVEGRLVIDRRLFEPTRSDVGVPPFDEAPEWPYNAIPDALHLAGALMRVELASTRDVVQARTWPPLNDVSLDATALRLIDADCADWDDHWQRPQALEDAPGRWRIVLQGAYPRGCEAQAQLQLLDRDVLAERLVRALWAQLGGRWTQPSGRAVEAALPAGAQRIARHDARPWGEVLRRMNKASDNPQTRLLYLALGAAGAPDGRPTLERARAEVERWFDVRGVDRRGLVMDNGSGLSRSERIAPRTLAAMIDRALDGAYAPELLMSLPLAGVDGTMRRRLKGTRAEATARLKTGTLANVRALAGTVRDTRGDTWVVAAIVNHEQAWRGREALDALIEWVAESGARWR